MFFSILILFAAIALTCGIVFSEERNDAKVEIIAAPKSGKGPMIVHLEPKIKNLEGPVRFEWLFGDGQESAEMVPPPHYYEAGKYNVMLEVTDGRGKKYTAGISVDAASPG
ncbi:MAG: hypothetical protein HY957_01725 [Nitrospirae bacterium]|nr:hypothetical protein [Nitrospirota bacterium]